MRNNTMIKRLHWNSLTTIIGPGTIELGGLIICLSNHETELLLLHPQYFGTEWFERANNQDECPQEGCTMSGGQLGSDDYQLDSDAMRKGCTVAGDITMICTACTEGEMTEPLNSVRIIVGTLTIMNSWLENLDFLSNLELIYSPTMQAMDFRYNWLLSNMSLPKLRRIKSPANISIDINFSPLLPDVDNFRNVSNVYFTSGYDIFEMKSTLPLKEYKKTNFFRVRNYIPSDGAAIKFKLITYGFYYPPILISILFNLRSVTFFIFGNTKKSIGGLRLFYAAFCFVHLLIAIDSLIMYHDLAMIYFTPTPLLSRPIFYNGTFITFCTFLFGTRELAMKIPLATIIYVYIECIISMIQKITKYIRYLRFMFAMGLATFVFLNAPAFYSVTIRARITYDSEFFKYSNSHVDKYTIIASTDGLLTRASYSECLFPPCKGGFHIEVTPYSDGIKLNSHQINVEFGTIVLFGLFILLKFLDRRDWLKALPYDLSLVVILMQYSVLRYASLRTYLIQDFWIIKCLGAILAAGCGQPYTHMHTLAVATHHFVYVLLCIVSIFTWYTARYFHYLAKTFEIEKIRESSKKSGQDEEDIGNSFMKK